MRFVETIGLDFVFLDAEHVPRDREILWWQCQAYAAMNLAPVVRVPFPDPDLARMAVDAGAHGVIFPYVESIDQVKALVGAVKYSPLKGERLASALAHRDLNPATQAYLERRNPDAVAIINIESKAALDRIEDLCGVPGLDAVLIGPHDLTINLGIPEMYRHPDFDAAVRRIIQVARMHRLGAGIHYDFGIDQEVAWIKEAGANLIVHSNDVTAMARALREEIAAIKRAVGDAPAGAEHSPGDGRAVPAI